MYPDTVTYHVSSWNDAVVTASTNLLNGIAVVIPSLIGALIVLIIGWILAGWAKMFVKRALDTLRFDSFGERTGVTKFLHEAGFQVSPKEMLGQLVRWFIIISFFMASLSILGLPVVEDVLRGIVGYIPNVIAAVLILAGGIILASFISDVLRGTFRGMQVRMADTLADVAKWILVVFTVLAVIHQLKIVPNLIDILFTGVVGGLALGFGLMVGLGGKDVMNDIFRDWYNRMKKI